MRVTIPALFLAVAIAAPAHAGTIADKGAEAESLLDAGDSVGAVEALDQAMEEIWQRSPLVFRKAMFVNDASGFGLYQPRESSVFKPGEPLVVYAEPIGFAYGQNAVGGTEISLITDFALTDPDGKQLFAKEDFLPVNLPVRYHNREFQMKLTVNLTGLPAGSYIAKFHVRDRNSDKAGDFDLPFEVKGE